MIDELTVEMAKGKVLILDEVDYMIDHFSVIFKEQKGMITTTGVSSSFHSKKCYMLSATEEQFHSSYFDSVFSMSEEFKIRLPSVDQLLNKNHAEQDDNISKSVVGSNAEALHLLSHILKTEAKERPIIVFVEVN